MTKRANWKDNVDAKHKDLVSYIDLINKKRRNKKFACKTLRVQAILREAYGRAIVSLRNRQIQDIEEWQRRQAAEAERAKNERIDSMAQDKYDPFQDPSLRQELQGLDNFMAALSSCKVIKAEC